MRNKRDVIISLSIVASGIVLTAPLWPGNEHRCPVSPTRRGSDAEALPTFARKYNCDCSMCHTVWPRLNRTGYIFRRMGYRMPYEVDNTEEGTGKKTTSKHGPRTGEDVFITNCNGCHTGGGNVISASKPIKGSEFNAKYRDDSTLANVIRAGISETAMPAFDQSVISDVEMNRLCAYIRKLTPGGSVQSSKPAHAGPLTGKEVFDRSCAGCHKDGGNSFNPAKGIKGPEFTKKFPDEGSLSAVIRAGVKGTPMPAFNEGALSNEELKNLMQYIRSLSK